MRDRVTELMYRERVPLDGFYYCPHHSEGVVQAYAVECMCRKPMPGMLVRAAREHDIDLQASWMLGDILHDVEAGNRAGCRTVLIDSVTETQWRLGLHRMPGGVVADIYLAAVIIAGLEASSR